MSGKREPEKAERPCSSKAEVVIAVAATVQAAATVAEATGFFAAATDTPERNEP